MYVFSNVVWRLNIAVYDRGRRSPACVLFCASPRFCFFAVLGLYVFYCIKTFH